MEILAYVVIGFLLIRWMITLVNWLSSPMLFPGKVISKPLVSILIPARNEAHNLPHLFDQLLSLKYPQLEILVLNDHSEDATEAILADFAQKNKNIRFVNGLPLPHGWLGKNWACHQLSAHALGEFLLFMDADIMHIKPELVESGLAFAENKKLALLSLFPDQIMKTSGERVVVPIMHFILLSLLPLWAIYYLPFPSMAAANGQFMLFRASDYHKFRWHERVKRIIVEDIAIMQEVKRAKLKGMTLLANGQIHCRMYTGYRTGIDGFSKNLLAGFGNNIAGLLLYLFLVVVAWGILVYYLPLWITFASVTLIYSMRIMISMSAGQKTFDNLCYHPLQMVSLLWIGLNAIRRRLTSSNEWKGRKLP